MRCCLAEYQKHKHTFTKKLVLIAPAVMIVLSLLTMPGQYFASGCYNFWYSLILPGTIPLMCAGIVQKDKKKLKYRSILSLPFNPARTWTGKIVVTSFFIMTSCAILFIGITMSGVLRNSLITFWQSAAASFILFVTFLWQIPLCLILTAKVGMFASIFINLVGNIAGIVCFAETAYWWIPYAIPSRLMCPILHLYPNGLFISETDSLLNANVVFPGVSISLTLFVVLTIAGALWFSKKEVD